MAVTEMNIERIKYLVAKGLLKTALLEIENLPIRNKELKKEFILIEARYYSYKANQNKKILSNDELDLIRNQINQSILEFSEKIFSFKEENPKKHVFLDLNKFEFILFCVLFGLIAAILKNLISSI